MPPVSTHHLAFADVGRQGDPAYPIEQARKASSSESGAAIQLPSACFAASRAKRRRFRGVERKSPLPASAGRGSCRGSATILPAWPAGTALPSVPPCGPADPKARRNHPRVVQRQTIPALQKFPQISDMMMGKRTLATINNQRRAFVRDDARRLGNQLPRQVVVVLVNFAHRRQGFRAYAGDGSSPDHD